MPGGIPGIKVDAMSRKNDTEWILIGYPSPEAFEYNTLSWFDAYRACVVARDALSQG